MIALLKEIRHNPLLWLLSFVPVVFIAGKAWPEAHTLLFLLSVLDVPLAALLSHATESVAAKTGDAVGGLLNATLRGCGCGGRDGFGIFRRTQEPAGPKRGHCTRKRLPDRALRGAHSRAAQLRHRPGTNGSAVLAGRRGNDAHRHPHRFPRDQQRPIGVVRRRARTMGLPYIRPDALFAATRCQPTVSYG